LVDGTDKGFTHQAPIKSIALIGQASAQQTRANTGVWWCVVC
jgi:hypothetical protein